MRETVIFYLVIDSCWCIRRWRSGYHGVRDRGWKMKWSYKQKYNKFVRLLFFFIPFKFFVSFTLIKWKLFTFKRLRRAQPVWPPPPPPPHTPPNPTGLTGLTLVLQRRHRLEPGKYVAVVATGLCRMLPLTNLFDSAACSAAISWLIKGAEEERLSPFASVSSTSLSTYK